MNGIELKEKGYFSSARPKRIRVDELKLLDNLDLYGSCDCSSKMVATPTAKGLY